MVLKYSFKFIALCVSVCCMVILLAHVFFVCTDRDWYFYLFLCRVAGDYYCN